MCGCLAAVPIIFGSALFLGTGDHTCICRLGRCQSGGPCCSRLLVAHIILHVAAAGQLSLNSRGPPPPDMRGETVLSSVWDQRNVLRYKRYGGVLAFRNGTSDSTSAPLAFT